MHRTSRALVRHRATARAIAALALMTAAGTATAQVTAISRTTLCNSPVLSNPSATTPLRIQAGVVEFEIWGRIAVSIKRMPTLSGFAALQPVTLVSTRSATENSARGCPAQSSAVLRVSNPDSLTAQINGAINVPLPDGTTQRIGLSVMPHPSISWHWGRTPVGGQQASCFMPGFEHQYSSNTVLNLKIPFDATLGVLCKQQLASQIFSGQSGAHITTPIPLRLTTELVSLPSVDLPVPIAPEAMPTEIPRPRSGSVFIAPGVSVPIVLSNNGVLRRNRDFPLAVTTPNGQSAQLMVSIVRKPREYRLTIGSRSAAAESPHTLTGTAIDLTFGVDPAIEETLQSITWRLTNPTCFAAVSGPYNPASAFQVFNLQRGASLLNIRLMALHTAGCIPSDVRVETVQAWVGTDTSLPPTQTYNFEVGRNPQL